MLFLLCVLLINNFQAENVYKMKFSNRIYGILKGICLSQQTKSALQCLKDTATDQKAFGEELILAYPFLGTEEITCCMLKYAKSFTLAFVQKNFKSRFYLALHAHNITRWRNHVPGIGYKLDECFKRWAACAEITK